MPTVTITNEKRSITVPEGTNLRKAALRHGVSLYSGADRYLNCRGLGLCGTCRVHVKSGRENLSRVGFWEWLMTRFHPFRWWVRIGEEDKMRLACRTKVLGDVEIETRPPLNLHGQEKFWV